MPPIAPVTLAALRRARDLIDRDYAEALDLDAMAREAGYSKYHFARSFAMAYGETPRAYLTRRRVERAKNLLRTANLSVTEVCFLVGLESLGSFMSSCSTRIGPSASTRSSLASRVRNDSILDDFRWLTVGPKEQPDLAILLAYPAPPMFSDQDAQTLRALVAKGALGGGVIETDDCRATYASLSRKA